MLHDARFEMLHARAEELPLVHGSVDCIVTSPPYNVGKEYDPVDDKLEWAEYIGLAELWAAEMLRVLKPGGRLWVNVSATTNQEGDDGRERGYRTNMLRLWMDVLEDSGLLQWRTVRYTDGDREFFPRLRRVSPQPTNPTKSDNDVSATHPSTLTSVTSSTTSDDHIGRPPPEDT